jgi:hypothetical protein
MYPAAQRVVVRAPFMRQRRWGKGEIKEGFSTSDREYDWECLIAMRRREKNFAQALSEHHFMFPYRDRNDVPFVL